MAKTALVTGASGGIGYELAQLLARDGYELILAARSIDKLSEIKADFESRYGVAVTAVKSDLSKPHAAKSLMDSVEGRDIDVLINNAGFGDFGEFWDCDIDKQTDMLNLNIIALTELTHAALPYMRKAGGGMILNVASLGAFQPGPLMSVYYASKAYVLSFSEALHKEMKKSRAGIKVSALCPGPTKTNFAEAAELGMSGLFVNLNVASAAGVARYGYKSLKKNKAVAIPGLSNKLAAFAVRLMPRSAVRAFVYRLQKKRQG